MCFPDDGQRCRDSIEDGPARTYSLGIVPQHKAADLAARWVPLLQYLSARTGLHVEFRTARDIPTFEQQLAQGEYDFAYMNPFQYVLFQQKSGYRALARQRAYGLRGIVVVRADSPLPHAPGSGRTGAGLSRTQCVRREHINARAITRRRHTYHAEFRGVARFGVLRRGQPAVRRRRQGAETLDRLDPAVRAQLRVLWTSAEYTPHAFAAHARVPASVAEILRQALIETSRDPRGKRLLAAAGFQELVAANDEEYEAVRKLVPGIRAALCASTESVDDRSQWLCPAAFAGNETRARVVGVDNPGF